jgi:hypothetical protein
VTAIARIARIASTRRDFSISSVSMAYRKASTLGTTGRVIGKLTRHSLKAVDEIAKIMKAGENGAVRLNAAKAIISALMDVENHSMTMRSLSDLTNRLKALEQATDAPPRKAV